MHDSIDILSRHLGPAVLVLVRLGGLAIFAPVFASSMVPRLIKVLLITMLALATYPTLAVGPLRGVDVPVDLASIAPMMASELMVGAVIGFLAIMPLVALQMGGQVMGTQMGLVKCNLGGLPNKNKIDCQLFEANPANPAPRNNCNNTVSA